MAAFLDLAAFKLRTVMPSADVDAIELIDPGYLDKRLTGWSGRIEARLRKRYAIPLEAPYPETILEWLTDIVTLEGYLKRGWNPSSAQDALIEKASDTAKAELKEAADSEKGLFDLPLREDLPGTSGVAFGGPLGYSEADPYQWMDVQEEAVRG